MPAEPISTLDGRSPTFYDIQFMTSTNQTAGVEESTVVNHTPPDKAPLVTSAAELTNNKESETRPRTPAREFIQSLVETALMALFGMTFILQAVKVPTGSMENTILIGDHLLVNKFIFPPGGSSSWLPFLPQREIRRGDIIVFKYPGNKIDPSRDSDSNNIPYRTNYVKRVIGLPGDTIEVRGARVYINGSPLPEHRIVATDHNNDGPLEVIREEPRKDSDTYDVYYKESTISDTEGISYRDFGFNYAVNGEIRIPDGYYFAMGDNRDNSLDSRAWGFVPRDLIVGRAMFVYWSYDESKRSSSNFIVDFFTNSRWSRTGTLIR